MAEVIYYLEVDGLAVAELSDPKCVDRSWWDYRLDATSLESEQSIRKSIFWEGVSFRIVDANGEQPNPRSFVGEYGSYCDGLTDRMSFHSLPPPPEERAGPWSLWTYLFRMLFPYS